MFNSEVGIWNNVIFASGNSIYKKAKQTFYIQLNPHLQVKKSATLFTVDSVSNNSDLMPHVEFMAVLVDAAQK